MRARGCYATNTRGAAGAMRACGGDRVEGLGLVSSRRRRSPVRFSAAKRYGDPGVRVRKQCRS